MGFPQKTQDLSRAKGSDSAGAPSSSGQVYRQDGAGEGDDLEGVATPGPLLQPSV